MKRASDVLKAVNVTAEIPSSLKADLSGIREELGGLRAETARIGIIKPKEKFSRRLADFLRSDRATIITTITMLLFAMGFILAGLYLTRWSPDAWARRAYEAAEKANAKVPGYYYEQVRTTFRSGDSSTAKGITLDLERKAAKKEDLL